jgi:hypothetical protein
MKENTFSVSYRATANADETVILSNLSNVLITEVQLLE